MATGLEGEGIKQAQRNFACFDDVPELPIIPLSFTVGREVLLAAQVGQPPK